MSWQKTQKKKSKLEEQLVKERFSAGSGSEMDGQFSDCPLWVTPDFMSNFL